MNLKVFVIYTSLYELASLGLSPAFFGPHSDPVSNKETQEQLDKMKLPL
jgi:hypothetical protein